MEFTRRCYDAGWESGWDDMKIYGPTARHTRRFIFAVVLEHIPDDVNALKNLHAMTGGHLVLSVPLAPLLQVKADRMGHVHGYSRNKLEKGIGNAGFEIVKAFQWGFPFYNLHRRLVNLMPAESTGAAFSYRKKLISNLVCLLFYLNPSAGGERYYVLCRPSRTGE